MFVNLKQLMVQNDGLRINGTYLWGNARSFRTAQSPLEMYYRLGLRVITISKGERDASTAVGSRVPLGLLLRLITRI